MKIPIIPGQASKFAEDLDPLFYVLVLLTVVFTGIVLGFILYLAIKYRREANVDRSRPIDEHHLLEITWSVIPLILGLAVFVWGAKLFAVVFGPAPKNSMEIFVVAKQWMWHMQHTNGIRENNKLHLPLGRPVKLTMISQDTIHGFFVPEFRIHMDVVPGRYTQTWFIPSKVGQYHLLCAQYCGTNHSQMTGTVYVMEPADYARWLAGGGDDAEKLPSTMEDAGKNLYEIHQCGNCHDPDGGNRGPSLVGLYGSRVKLKDGRMGAADNAYLREAIINPSEKISEKYQQVMPSYKEYLTEEQILQLIAYIKSLRAYQPAASGPAQPPRAGNTGAPR